MIFMLLGKSLHASLVCLEPFKPHFDEEVKMSGRIITVCLIHIEKDDKIERLTLNSHTNGAVECFFVV